MKLKICGMKYPDNIQSVAKLQPDYLGFIFYEKSARHFDLIQLPEISKNIKRTGVFVNASVDFVLKKVQEFKLKAVQLHGNESPEFCSELKRHYTERSAVVTSSKEKDGDDFSKKSNHDNTLEIIKVFSIKDTFDFSSLKAYERVCDYFLFDTKGPLPGGNGYTFNWNILSAYPSKKPFFLSGGIGPDELENIQAFAKSPASKFCFAIDVNSKFESKPGLKNIDVLKQFKQHKFLSSKDTET